MKHTLSRFGVAALVSSTILSTLAPIQSYAATYAGTVNTPILNVRSDTSTTSDIVGKLTEGTTVDVYSVNDDWAQIEFEGQKRYVSSTYLTVDTTTPSVELYVADTDVNLRSSMSTTSSVVTVVPEDAIVTFVSAHGATDSWFKVTYGTYTGYVAARYFNSISTSFYAKDTSVLYDQTGTGASKIATIPAGAKVTYLDSLGATGSWFKIEYGSLVGYAPARNFSSTLLTAQATTAYYATRNAALYDRSGTGATKIATIPLGAQVQRIYVNGLATSWFKVQYGNITGYASARNFSTTKPETVVKTTYYAVRDLVMYESSASGAARLRTIKEGTKVSQISDSNLSDSWFKIEYDGLTGYAAARHFSTNPPEVITVTPYYASTNVAMYDSSASGATKIETIPLGAKVEQISQSGLSDSWFKVKYNGKTGYAGSRHFSTTPPEVITITPYYATTNVAMYDSSAAGATKIDTIPFGAKVEQISQSGLADSWFKVKYDGKTGYAGSSHFSLKNPDVIVRSDYYATRDIVLYDRSDANKAKIAVIPYGTKVVQVSEYGLSSTLFKIEYGTFTGYATAEYFSKTQPPSERYDTERQVRIEVDGGGPLNVRSTPEILTTNKVGSLDTGTLVNVKPIIGSAWGLLTSGTYAGNYIHLGYTVTVPTTPPATEITKVVNYTSYPMTVQAMADRQEAEFAQTDFHLYDPAYLPRAWVSVSGETGTIVKPELKVVSGLGTALKMSASSSAATLITVPSGGTVSYVSRSGSWYKVKYGTMTGYVTFSSVMGTAEILSKPLLSSHVYGLINPGEQVKITGQDGNYYTVYYKRPAGYSRQIYDYQWRLASPEEILTYVDPSRIDPNSRSFYQFLDLSKSAGTTATILNKMLTSKGSLSGLGQAFVDAGKQYGINEVYLLSHALHETGNGTSLLASGVPVDKDGNALINIYGNRIYPEREVAATVYNMYGIQAVDSDPLGQGAKYAFQQGWFSPKQAVIGGAYWIGASYINHSTYKQNTLYKMRFNPAAPGTHQYATNIAWAALQTKQIYDVYQLLDAYTLHFDVPKYQ
ncbi:SH3 domain-containing protein [Exiguobacterium algae]|uniref:SH3 domain-containing protein n=1 Tax=Exiguobacterium algae TaxID=2751250 RepID=UPI001BE9AD6D|nr:SH3 domain-containing protein [Exiguobacterium algae]